jgi:hypothetical protein
MFAEINSHLVADLSRVTATGRGAAVPACVRCGAHFTDRLEIEETRCAGAGEAHGHDLVSDPEHGFLYCTRCPMVAYDEDDVADEPTCPMPLQARSQTRSSAESRT